MNQILIDIAVKGSLVLVAAEAAAWRLRDASAASRHLLWTVTVGSLVALPALSAALPEWRIGILPGTAAGGALPAGGAGWSTVAWIWLAGVAACVATAAVGRIRVWWLARRSVPLARGEWPALATRLAGRIGLSRRVVVRQVDRPVMPMTWGLLRPVVLLPASADDWSEALRRDVLLHELVHVKRNDYPTQLVSRLALALHWFNPLVWTAARRLRDERERACDDHVLETGASACDYAAHLVEMARSVRPLGMAPLSVGMTESTSRLGERIMALLDGGRRRRVLSARSVVSAGLAAACLVLPLSSLRPSHRGSPAPEAWVVREAVPAATAAPAAPSANGDCPGKSHQGPAKASPARFASTAPPSDTP